MLVVIRHKRKCPCPQDYSSHRHVDVSCPFEELIMYNKGHTNNKQRVQQFICHWGWVKVDAISQTTFSIAFSCLKMFKFRLRFPIKFVAKGPINNTPALFQIMAWCRPGDKPLAGPMMISLPTYICVTRPQWVNNMLLNDYRAGWSYVIQLLIVHVQQDLVSQRTLFHKL